VEHLSTINLTVMVFYEKREKEPLGNKRGKFGRRVVPSGVTWFMSVEGGTNGNVQRDKLDSLHSGCYGKWGRFARKIPVFFKS